MDEEERPESTGEEETDSKEEKSISADLIRGHINTIILRALYDGDKYGYAIIAEIERKSHGQYTLKQPSLYSALKRLEKDGYVTSYWGGSVAGGRRKYFSLTEEGREIAETNQAEWEYSRTVIDSLISDKDFDFNNPAPTAVNMRVLRSSTSRVPSRGGEDDELDYEPSFDDSAEESRIAEEYSEKNASLEAEKAALEAEKQRFAEEVAARNAAYFTERDWRERELEAREKALEERRSALLAEHAEAVALAESRRAEEYADFEEETARFEERVRDFEEREESFRKEQEEAEDTKRVALEEAERRAALEEELLSKKAALDEEELERRAALEAEEENRRAALEEEESERRRALTAEETTRRTALDEEEAERRRILEDEEAERRAALEEEESSRRAALEEELAERIAAIEAQEEALRQRSEEEEADAEKEEELREKAAALEEEYAKKRDELEEEYAKKTEDLEDELEELRRRSEEENAGRLRLEQDLKARDEELARRTALFDADRERYADTIRQREELIAKERLAHAAELNDQEARIRRELDAAYREQLRQITHRNYLDLVSNPPQPAPESGYSYYGTPAYAPPQPAPEPVPTRERDYHEVLTDICAGAASTSDPAPSGATALSGMSFDDIDRHAVHDGIPVVTVGGPAPKQTDYAGTVHRGKALFFSAVVVFCLCIIEGVIAMAIGGQFDLPAFYPYFIWFSGLALVLITGLAYANRFGERSIRRRSYRSLINAGVIYALAVIVTLIVALALNMGIFESIPLLMTYVIVPIVYFFGIVVFGVTYFFLTRPARA